MKEGDIINQGVLFPVKDMGIEIPHLNVFIVAGYWHSGWWTIFKKTFYSYEAAEKFIQDKITKGWLVCKIYNLS